MQLAAGVALLIVAAGCLHAWFLSSALGRSVQVQKVHVWLVALAAGVLVLIGCLFWLLLFFPSGRM